MAWSYMLSGTVILVCIFTCAVCDGPYIETKLGTIKGKTNSVSFKDNKYNVDEYLGIPFAQPPVGKLRFKVPKPTEPFTEPFEATKMGLDCVQQDYLSVGFRSTNEDCLYLNIYVPQGTVDRSGGRAVMVWIHGGGFSMGAGRYYPGEVLAAHGDVIVVTINYRLGLYGFLNIGDERAPGNQGLFDQRLALQWVKDNIQAFGGDTNSITIFGESAGGISVTAQSLYPPNRGLFQNAIAQSGSASMPFIGAAFDTMDSAKFVAEEFGCKTETTDDVFACLQDLTAAQFVDFADDAKNDMQKMLKISFMPTTEGRFIKKAASDIIRNAKQTDTGEEVEFFRELNFMTGTNGQEGHLWLSFAVGSLDQELIDNVKITDEDIKTIWTPSMLGLTFIGQAIPEAVRDLVALEYTDWQNPTDARMQFVKLSSDVFFNIPGTEMGLMHANSSNTRTFMYNFRPSLDQRLVPTPDWATQANHGDEIAPVFGYSLDYEFLYKKTGYRPPEWELDLSERMMTYWSNFAKFGNPNGDGVETWPEYNMDTLKSYVFDRTDSVEDRLYTREVKLLREIVPALLDATKEHAHAEESPFAKKSDESCDAEGKCG
ncbi:EST2E-like protein [Mya arenaria]|uniref:Carboxylic ester hydrolase n=1 Tax=Mya arenaria TaxID=6604 RepID=A0ABY7F3X1_MYAAR|nr:EST2E-like protein [Mya arenaria]